MRDTDRLRADAESLAAQLPEFQLLERELSTGHYGGAPRKRAGHGEEFWQYRSQTPEDSASAIDWRRSATGDDFYIREQELQTARLMEIWVDPSEGFDWRSDENLPTKADEARVLLTALALRFAESGDLAAVLGSSKHPGRSSQLASKLIEDSCQTAASSAMPPLRNETGHVVIASDFYGNPEPLRNWVRQTAAKGCQGLLLQVVDPMEADFPFAGRVRFRRPGGALSRIFGRTEGLKDDYLERFKTRQAEIRAIAQRVGWSFQTCVVGEPRRALAHKLMTGLIHGASPA
ncbi:MAG: hypothetical protein CMK07_15915 [Ponticaulis sp.]|nr:hypothetical protein [Ponticaulis sp.]